ncbi:MAG: hypothetical protein GC129_00315 [Proteobacteria bacterium]|nr:hypothetical protein [Pseudomonadota bacterium]
MPRKIATLFLTPGQPAKVQCVVTTMPLESKVKQGAQNLIRAEPFQLIGVEAEGKKITAIVSYGRSHRGGEIIPLAVVMEVADSVEVDGVSFVVGTRLERITTTNPNVQKLLRALH